MKSEEQIVLGGYCGTSEQVCGYITIKLGTMGACIGSAAITWPISWVFKCIPVPGKPIFSCLKKDSKHGLEYLAKAESPSHCTQVRIPHLINGAIPNIMEQLTKLNLCSKTRNLENLIMLFFWIQHLKP
ncbi:hypothetical protein PS2_019831 [Malus domestica]